jgi:alpha/beta superfamily hydrolase
VNSTNLVLPKNARQLFIDGPAGVLDTLELAPKESIRGVAIIIHPDPKGGGTYTNKIVQTVAKVMNNKGFICYCPNLRGVGQSAGEHDFGVSEVDDATAIYDYVSNLYPELPIVLAGFSFGTAVVSNLALKREHLKLLLIGPAVTRYSVVVPNLAKTIVIHGKEDEVIPLDEVYTWAANWDIPVSVFLNTGHFFHGKLIQLQNYLAQMVVV